MANVPKHVAIIMDGNGRWAKERGLPKIAGHRAGIKAAEAALEAARESGVGVLTLYTFSTENWNRPKKEIGALFKLLENYLDKKEGELKKNDIKFRVIGRVGELPERLREKIKKTTESTKDHKGPILNLAINYGGRAELIDAAKALCKDVKENRIVPLDINEEIFSRYLYTAGLPDPDLIIRTSGEYRVSNFLLWQISYAELYVTEKLWPDFTKEDFKKALLEYQNRERKFGG